MAFGKQFREIAPQFISYRAPYDIASGPLPKDTIGADAAVQFASISLPHAEFVSLSLPLERLPVYQVRVRMPGEWRTWSGTSVVTVDAANGQVLDVYDASDAPLANKILESAFAVHSGEVAGLVGRILTMLAGLSLPTLYVTGVWAWLRKRRLKLRPSATAEAATALC